jgi:hypothetical protein
MRNRRRAREVGILTHEAHEELDEMRIRNPDVPLVFLVSFVFFVVQGSSSGAHKR